MWPVTRKGLRQQHTTQVSSDAKREEEVAAQQGREPEIAVAGAGAGGGGLHPSPSHAEVDFAKLSQKTLSKVYNFLADQPRSLLPTVPGFEPKVGSRGARLDSNKAGSQYREQE